MTMHILPPDADNFSTARQACRLAKGPIISALRQTSQGAATPTVGAWPPFESLMSLSRNSTETLTIL
jgi:hypothetical protein